MKKRLLVIDDDLDILRVLKANLELYGYDPVLAENWTTARGILEKQLPDLIILDLMLPDGNGVDICKDIRERYHKLPIIMLTAKDRVSDKVVGLESGADDYIVKPFETIELIARIKACLRRYCPVSEKITCGALTIDTKARTVQINEQLVELTPKEYALLCFLAANPGEVISRELIRKTIWKDSQIYAWSRVIDVHIQHLRKKIEQNPLQPEYIITIPGVGYKFKA